MRKTEYPTPYARGNPAAVKPSPRWRGLMTMAGRLPEDDGDRFVVLHEEADALARQAAECRRQAWEVYHEHIEPGASRGPKTSRVTRRTRLRRKFEELLADPQAADFLLNVVLR